MARMNRDVACSDAVLKMAELGRFDKEYVVYGTAMQRPDGKVYYFVNANEERLYHYSLRETWNGNCFTPIVYQRKRSATPSGMQESIEQALKYALMSDMKRQYESVGFFQQFGSLLQIAPNDNAYTLMKTYQRMLEGYFDEGKLQVFLGTLQTAYLGKVLTQSGYEHFYNWYKDMKQQVYHPSIGEGTLKRTLFGFVYRQNGVTSCMLDARLMNVVHQRNEKIIAGAVAAPILKNAYWIPQTSHMQVIKEQYKQWMLQLENDNYLDMLEQLLQMEGVVDADKMDALLQACTTSEYAKHAAAYYRAIWNQKA